MLLIGMLTLVKPISHSSLRDSSDISFQVQFNAEFPRQVMNFPIKRLNTQFNLCYVIVISIKIVSFSKGTKLHLFEL